LSFAVGYDPSVKEPTPATYRAFLATVCGELRLVSNASVKAVVVTTWEQTTPFFLSRLEPADPLGTQYMRASKLLLFPSVSTLTFLMSQSHCIADALGSGIDYGFEAFFAWAGRVTGMNSLR
jgi:hypothetical protein